MSGSDDNPSAPCDSNVLPFLGQIQATGFNFAQRGWRLCEGQPMDVTEHQALFSLIGTTYGGDGIKTFNLPDLRGRSIVHYGIGPGLPTLKIGTRLGREVNLLNRSNLPLHYHNAKVMAVDKAPDTGNPKDAYLGNESIYVSTTKPSMATRTAGSAILTSEKSSADTTPVEIRNPYQVLYYSICIVGCYPDRS